MPENLGLQVEVSANIKPLSKGLADARKELASTAAAAVKTDSSLGKLGGGANQATFALTNLGRIVQDAPFGFIGITNNINPLLESFQRLKLETGSTGSALKALAGSLIGAGGLGLAVSVVSSLLTVFALNSRSSGNATKEHKEKVDETKNAADDYARAISSASSADVSHQAKLVELNQVLRDTSNNFNTLSQNIINQALAEYLATQKEGLIKKILDAKVKEILEAQSAFSKVREYTEGIFSKDPNKRAVAEATADIKNLNNLVKSFGLTDIFGGIFKLDKLKVKPEKVEVDIPERKELFLPGKVKVPEIKFPEMKMSFKDTNIIIDGSIVDKTINGIQKLIREANLEALTQEFSILVSDAMKGVAVDVGETIGNVFADLATNKGNGLDNLFAGLFNSVGAQIQALGKFLIRSAIQVKIAKEAFKKLLDKPVLAIAVGIGLIALGAALKSAAKQQFKGFALGGRNIAGGVALVGERGPELVNLPKGSDVIPNSNFNNIQAGAMEVYGRIVAQGTELAVIIDRARATNRRNN